MKKNKLMMQAPQYWRATKSSALRGEWSPPGDKSITHRALLLAALSNYTWRLHNASKGLDCLATLKAIQCLGVDAEANDLGYAVHGVGLNGLKPPKDMLNAGNSGTLMRLLTGILAAQPFFSSIQGDCYLNRRPMCRVTQPLIRMGASIIMTESNSAPLYIHGSTNLKGINLAISVNSAQVVSSIELASLCAGVRSNVQTPGVYRDHTTRMIPYFIKQQLHKNYVSFNIPGDLSSAAFFVVAATLIPGSNITISNVGLNPTRDGFIHVLRCMGADITVNVHQHNMIEPTGDIIVKHAPLRGIDVPIEWVSLALDEWPILCVAAACAKGVTRFHGAAELRVKETDRLHAITQGLSCMGIRIIEYSDGLDVFGGTLQGARVHSFADHRIAMALAIAGACATGETIIDDVDMVDTSFPFFAEVAKDLGLSIEVGEII